MISEETSTFPEPEYHWFGIGIKSIDANYNHCGIVYFDTEEKKNKILHLAFHNDLRIHELKEDYRWVKLTELYDIDGARDFAHHCNWIARKNVGKVPYGVKYDKALICDKTKIFDLNGGEGVGVTCATWVMLVFKAFSIELIDFNSWEIRDSDPAWHQKVVDMLKSVNASEEHIASVKAESPCIRIRPEEIAASCNAENKPATFKVVAPLGRIVHSECRR